MDDSGSIENQDFDDMKTFIIDFIHSFHIGPQNVRMGLVKYASEPTLQFDLTTYSDAVTLEKAVLSIRHEGGGTRTGMALSSMVPHFDKKIHGVPQYLLVITDGKSQDEVLIPAKTLKDQGVIILAIGVKNASEAQLKEIADEKTFFVNHFDALKSIKDNIMTHICAPDICKDIYSDVFFLVDSSESISEEDYQKMKEFMKSVIDQSDIGETSMHVGVMQFSTRYKLEFPLTQYYSKQEIFEAIDGMQHLNEGTRTGTAITEVSTYFDTNQGGRSNLAQNLVVITDGKSNDAVKDPAAALRHKGVVVYAFGVEGANKAELKDIAGSSDRVFNVKDFDALRKLESQLALKLCDPTRVCKKTIHADIIFLVDGSGSIDKEFSSIQTFMELVVNKTLVGKSLTRFGNGVQVYSVGVKDANKDELMTMAGGDESKVFYVGSFVALEFLHRNISEELCETTKPVCPKNRLNLVFLLDQSDNTNPDDYAIMKSLTKDLVKSFKVGKEFVHIGLAQFSNDHKKEFNLEEYFKTDDMIEHIDKMEKRGGGGHAYIEKALYRITEYFEASRDCQGCKYLILMTNGDSQDDVEDAADRLRNLGIEVFVVGFGNLHILQLLQIAHGPERVYKIQNNKDKEIVKNNLIEDICKDERDPPSECTVDIAIGFDITRRTRDPDEKIFSGHPKLQILLPEIIHRISSLPGIGSNPIATQIAFHIVDRNGRALYDTNFEDYKDDVVDKIVNLPLSQLTYFNRALLQSFKTLFTAKSRATVKVMVIFSDGLDEKVTDLETKKKI
ncbi:Collagen alpha-5(VI) chain Collagen alpha-1(XXIX) chain von [Larimichthys crocea]|uniref:Collagen alpha-5(VI) chain Collagen alpha-1(XXIX) chain von n=1 Tax=Larimichthys crocea TaxID=215358 RepID=A0A6G0ICU3_LARCR|nr:Collagen alpha-5(VI) chain Collagen alpha-1(XXIX) chain von [Larimichthys crocea]